MATRVFNTEEIELLDGSTVILRPLAIKQLRKFMERFHAWNSINIDDFIKDVDPNDSSSIMKAKLEYENVMTDGLMNVALSCLTKTRPDLVKLDEDGDPVGADILDLDTIYKIIEVCGGIKLNDPKSQTTQATE